MFAAPSLGVSFIGEVAAEEPTSCFLATKLILGVANGSWDFVEG